MSRYTHYIYLYREDRVAQAVSWYIAAVSGVFTSVNRGKDGKTDPLAVKYNRDEIGRRVALIASADQRWRTYFEQQGIDALMIKTEDMLASGGMRATVRSIFKHLGISAPRSFKTQFTLEKLVNPLKAEFIDRYNAGD